MSNDYSLTMIVPASDRDAANTWSTALGWGAIFSVGLSADGDMPITYYACHDFVSAEYIATMEAIKASTDPALDGLNNLYLYYEESSDPKWADGLANHVPALIRYQPPLD